MQDIQYSGEFEKKICAPYWKYYFDNPEKLQRATGLLKRNMDKCEQEKVDIILERLSKVIEGGDTIKFLPDEVEKLINMENAFNKKITKVNAEESYYEWNGYKLPFPTFDVSVYYYQCGIGSLKDVGKIRILLMLAHT